MGLSIKLVHNRRKKHGKPAEKLPVHIRCTIERKSFFIDTNVKIVSKHWDSENKKIKSNNPEWIKLNLIIEGKQKKIEDYYNSCLLQDRDPSKNKILELFNMKSKDTVVFNDFLEFMEYEIKTRSDIAENTRKTHKTRFDKIKEFTGGKLNFEDLTFDFLEKYEIYLKNVRGNKINTIWGSHKDLNTYIGRAIKHGYISTDINPYNHFTKKKEESSRQALESNELELFENYEVKSNSEQVILDRFLFSCYTGLRISDQNLITKDNFLFTTVNECYLTYKMKKVKTTVRNLPIHKLFNGKAMPIVKKYIQQDEETLFPYRSDQHTNRKLKDIAKELDINKRVTTHVGRHTFGSILAEKTNDPILIKTLMGHTKIETSMIYINMSKSRLENKVDLIKWD